MMLKPRLTMEGEPKERFYSYPKKKEESRPAKEEKSQPAFVEVEKRRPSSNKSINVMLTNWKRVANVPDSIDGPVQAVQWRDYIVFLDKKGDMYLYHYKCGIWSSLHSKNACTAANGCPLAVLNQDLILLSSSGDFLKLIVGTGHWKANETLNMEDKKQILAHVQQGVSQFGGERESSDSGSGGRGRVVCRYISDPDGVVLIPITNHSSLCLLLQNKKGELYLKKFHNSKWSRSIKLQRAFLSSDQVSHISYAVLEPYLYVNINSGIYCVNTDQHTVNLLTVTSIPLPPLAISTICGVNNTIFSFGGRDEDGQPSSDVFRYNLGTKEWEPAGYMRSSRYSITVSPFLRDEENTDIIAIGGTFGEDKDNNPPTVLKCRIAEICEVSLSCE